MTPVITLYLNRFFPLLDIEKDFLSVFKIFYNDKNLRTCKKCGTEMQADKRFTS